MDILRGSAPCKDCAAYRKGEGRIALGVYIEFVYPFPFNERKAELA